MERRLRHGTVLVNFGINHLGENETKENYALIKLNVPKRVTPPNGRTFIARYKRIKRSELSPKIVMRRTYTQRDVEDVECNKGKEFLAL